MRKLLILAGLTALLSGCAVVPYQTYQDSPRTVVTTQYSNGSVVSDYSVTNRYYDPYPTYGYAPLYSPFIYPSVQLNFSNRSYGHYNGYRGYRSSPNHNWNRGHR